MGSRPNGFRRKLDFFLNVILRQNFLFHSFKVKTRPGQEYPIIGIIRERNESSLLQDTLDHMSQFVDGIIVYDDDSEDDSLKIAMEHPSVIEVVANRKWRRHPREWEETSSRKLLHDRARRYGPKWIFYFDADERFEGDIRDFLLHDCPSDVNGINITLLDAYITKDDKKPFKRGGKLLNFRKNFGPEKRDILMIWRNMEKVDFTRPDTREPQGITEKEKLTKFYCQHYGKAQSIEHWEDTCRYYANFFPKYSEKWRARMGKAVHTTSDFGNKLYSWEDAKKQAFPLSSIQDKGRPN